MYQSSKKLVTHKEHCCFDHSDFPARSIFTFDVCWGSVSSGTQVQPQVILDPDHLPGYLSVSYDDANSKLKSKKFILSYQLEVEKYLVSLQVTNSMVKLLFCCFRVTYSRLKNKKIHSELLTRWLDFSHIRVMKVKLINEKNSLIITVSK